MELNELIDILIKDSIENIHTAIPGVIEEFDGENMTAKVSPLDENYPLLIEVPVAFFKTGKFAIRPPYKKGDVVQILFNEKALDLLINNNKKSNSRYLRKFSLDDGVIIGGILTEDKNLSSENISDYVIKNLDTGNKFIIYENGGIELYIDGNSFLKMQDNKIIINNTTIKIGSDNASEKVPFLSEFNNLVSTFNDLVSKFNTHAHSGVATGGGTSGTPSTSASSASQGNGTQKSLFE